MGDEEYREELNGLMRDHKILLEEKQEQFDDLLSNIRD